MQHPVGGHKNGLVIWSVVALILVAGQILLYNYSIGGDINIIVVDAVVSILLFSIFALFLWFPLEALSKSRKSYLSHVINLTVVGGVVIVSWIYSARLIITAFLPEYDQFWTNSLSFRISEGLLLYALVVLIYYLEITLHNLSEKKARESELETLVRDTELKMLRSQINPHFLFNSLNSISSLTVTDPEKARAMVIKLSEFMRYALSRKNDQLVPLSSELECIRLYIDIEKIRFGDRMEAEEEIDENALEARLPVMLLQPLYENAVKHGVYESTGHIKISTKINLLGESVEIVVINNYDTDATPVKGTGTGLLNTARRLDLQYGKRSMMETYKSEGRFTARIVIPFSDSK